MAAAGPEHAAGPSTDDKDMDLYSDLNQNDEVSLALKSMQKQKSMKRSHVMFNETIGQNKTAVHIFLEGRYHIL